MNKPDKSKNCLSTSYITSIAPYESSSTQTQCKPNNKLLPSSRSPSTAHLVAPLEEDDGRAVVRHRARDYKRMEYLVAVAGEIEPPGLPPFRHPRHVEDSPRQVRRGHGRLVGQRHVTPRLAPVHDGRMHRGHDAREAHAREKQGTVRSELAGGQLRREEGEDGDEAHGGDGHEVGDLPVRVALEDVVDGGEEGGHNHDGDADVVHAQEEQVEAVRVAAEEVAAAAREEAEHGAAEEHEEWPSGCSRM
ncbi:hypothetical protein BHM03_00063069 [Ensete ventricosum]|nr:hypothetical protein BHM03_00063069 [Ensete ventricosum]